ncbi:MAG: hypothetical protein HQ515_04260 [Phycisphaeraceae bacterium]|nr:hypothetical protein [Phycisphaeraceae bacterium]
MNIEPTTSHIHYERLLDDIFLDADLTHFKEDVLNQCQCELTRRRVRRHNLSILTGVAALLLLALFISYVIKTPRTKSVEGTNTPDYIVRTRALSDHQIVHTTGTHDTVKTQNADCVVYSMPGASDLIVQKHYQIARLTDSDMLNEFKGIPCGIIHIQGGTSKFVFFKPDDTQRFFRTP